MTWNEKRKQQAEKEFRELAEKGGYNVKGEYKGNNIKVPMTCPDGHDFLIYPSNFVAQKQRCPICYNENKKIKSEQKFRELAKQENFIVDGEYKRNKTKISMTCPEGHKFEISPSNFKYGHRCPKCYRENKKLKTEQEFKKITRQENYIVNSEYKTTHTKISMTCPEGHTFLMTPSHFKSGHRCPKCLNRCPEQAEKEFRELAEEEGYVVNGEYKNNVTKFSMTCPEGHTFLMTPKMFKGGQRCPKCLNRCPEQAEKEFRELAENEGYKVEGEYKNNKTKISITCSVGHTFLMTPNKFKNGHRCPKCLNRCPEQAEKEFRELAENEGYKVEGEYKTTHTKISMTCPEGHTFLMEPNNFKSGHRCPKCQGSTGQRLLAKLIEQELSIKPEENVKGLLKGRLELDLYFPSMNVAIEYQGNYWHNLPEKKIADKLKKKLCKKRGIHLIEVWDNDFMNNQEETLRSVVNEISNFL